MKTIAITLKHRLHASRFTRGIQRNMFAFMMLLMPFLLTNCGFHLRGMVDMPPWFNYVSVVIQNATRDLEPLLNEQLKAYHIHVCDDPSKAKYWLIIEQDSMLQQITSVSSSTTPRQYQLTYKVYFKLQQANGKELIPSSSIVVTRQLTVNSNRILGSNAEEALLKQEMQRDAVIQLLDRLVVLTS